MNDSFKNSSGFRLLVKRTWVGCVSLFRIAFLLMKRLLTMYDFYHSTFPLMMKPAVAVFLPGTSSGHSFILDLSPYSSRSQTLAPVSALKSSDLLLDSWASRSSGSISVPTPLLSSSAAPEMHLRPVFLLLSDLSNSRSGHSFRASRVQYGTTNRDSWRFQPSSYPPQTAPTSEEQYYRSSPASAALLSYC